MRKERGRSGLHRVQVQTPDRGAAGSLGFRVSRILVILFLGMVVVPPAVRGSTREGDDPGDRPRIGLALGGGGARGLAHAGVLRWLEEHRIPVDYVAGTSMGGLLGGVYATGVDADSLAALIAGLDWPLLLSGSPPYRMLIMRRKEDRRNILGGVDLSLARGVATASGLSAGHYVNLLLSRVALDHSTLASFDGLPIPFRCVAVDLVSGTEVVLDRSPLNRSMRATMAIPGVFTAVEIDSMVLVDGGIVNNLPADVVKRMGADVVLAIDVGEPLDPDERIESIPIALKRAQMITANLLTDPRLVNADVVVKPDLEGYSILAFQAADSLAARGYAAMEAMADRLEPYRLDETAWAGHLAARKARRRRDGAGPVGDIFLRGASPVDSVRAVRELGRKMEGVALDPRVLEDALSDLYGWGKYEAFDYRRTADGEGMIIETHPVAQGPPYLRLGLEVDGTESEDIEFSLKSRLLFLDRTGFGSEFRGDLDLGTYSRLSADWYQPVIGPLFASVAGFWSRRATVFFENDERLAEYWLRSVGGEVAVGYGVVRRIQEIRAGYRLSDEQNTVRTGDPGLPETQGTREELFLEWTVDTQDDPVVPYFGIRGRVRGSRFLQVPDGGTLLYKAEGRIEVAVPMDRRQSILVAAAGGTAFEDAIPLFLDFALGGPYRLGAFHRDELRGSRYAYGALGVSRRVSEGLLPLHLFVAGETGSVSEPGGGWAFRGCGTVMVIAETPLGPGIVGGSAGSGRSQIYFALGTRF